NHMLRLVAVLLRHLLMLRKNLLARKGLLAFPRHQSSELCRARAGDTVLPLLLFDLLPPRTCPPQKLLTLAFDFSLPILAAFDLIAQRLQPHRKLRTISSRRVPLRSVQLARLQRPCFAIFALCNIGDKNVRMELGSCVVLDWPGAIVLEAHGHPRASRFCVRM